MNIYIGNLSSDVTEDDIREAFEAYGKVESVNIIKDKYSGEPRGFGFVEMPSVKEGQAVIKGLSGTEVKGKNIIVNEARSRPERGGRGGGGRSGNRR